jgi:hypothetical protein
VRNKANLSAVGIPHHSTNPAFQSDADCAKRTQFPEIEITLHSTVPSFQYSNPRQICAKQTQFGQPGRRVGSLEGEMCETKPIPAGWDFTTGLWVPCLRLVGMAFAQMQQVYSARPRYARPPPKEMLSQRHRDTKKTGTEIGPRTSWLRGFVREPSICGLRIYRRSEICAGEQDSHR